jgi:hypothetical protein
VDPVAPTIAILPLLLPTATDVAITNILKISENDIISLQRVDCSQSTHRARKAAYTAGNRMAVHAVQVAW